MEKLKEIFPDFITSGAIFKNLEDNNRLPWASIYSGSDQDVEYITRSGGKYIAPLVSVFVVDGSISSNNLTRLCDIVWGRFGRKWSKLWETMQIEYDPLSLFRVSTTESIVRDNTGTITDDRDVVNNKEGTSNNTTTNDRDVTNNKEGSTSTAGTDKRSVTDNKEGTTSNNSTNNRSVTDNKEGTFNNTATNENTQNIFGYNSVSHSPSNDSSGSDTKSGNYNDENTISDNSTITGGGSYNDKNVISDDVTRSGSGSYEDKNTISDDSTMTESGSYKDGSTISDDNTRTLDTNEKTTRTNEREGNVGLLSNQSLIKQELEIRAYDLFKIVYKDLDSLLVLSVYESEV